MNGTATMIKEFHDAGVFPKPNVILCVPFHLLSCGGNAQDCSVHTEGAFTGEVSAKMIRDMGAKYCIVGHSERRQNFGETSEFVAKKATRCLENGLIPIICVGETLAERESGGTLKIIEDQVWQSIPNTSEIKGEVIVAYEPVWAIGTGLIPVVSDIEKVHNHIKDVLGKMGIADTAVVYGGSVSPDNAAEIMGTQNVDGVLVGGASLSIEKFKGIIDARG